MFHQKMTARHLVGGGMEGNGEHFGVPSFIKKSIIYAHRQYSVYLTSYFGARFTIRAIVRKTFGVGTARKEKLLGTSFRGLLSGEGSRSLQKT